MQIALLLLSGWVIYVFYARLRDIADELRRFRIAYEMAQERAVRGQSRAPTAPAADNPLSGEARYMPRK